MRIIGRVYLIIIVTLSICLTLACNFSVLSGIGDRSDKNPAKTNPPLVEITKNAAAEGNSEKSRPSDDKNKPLKTATSRPLIKKTPTIEPTVSDSTGAISGNLSFPGEFIPRQQVVAFQLKNNQWNGTWFSTITKSNSKTYIINDIPPGKYWIVTYSIPEDKIDAKLSAGYTQAVVCGLSVDCTDHRLKVVEVHQNETLKEIDPGDRYAPENSFPENPDDQSN